MFKLNGKTLPVGKAFVHDGMQYPSNWLALTSLEEKQAIGIVEEPDVLPANWDGRFYWSPSQPKDLDTLKADWTAKVKEAAGRKLSETDWYVVRQAENSAAVPADVLTSRAFIRTKSGEKEAAIAACEDVAALVTYVTGLEFLNWEPAPEPEPEPTPEPEATPEPTPTETPEETPSEE